VPERLVQFRLIAGSLFGPLGLAQAYTLAAFTADELVISLRALSEVNTGSTGVVVGIAGVREPLLGSTGVVVVLGPIPGLRTTTTSVERSGASLTSLIATTTGRSKGWSEALTGFMTQWVPRRRWVDRLNLDGWTVENPPRPDTSGVADD